MIGNKGLGRHRARTIRNVIVNLLVLLVAIGGYYLLVLQRQRGYEIERGFRALHEIHRQAEARLEAVAGLFNAIPIDPPSGGVVKVLEPVMRQYGKMLGIPGLTVKCMLNKAKCETTLNQDGLVTDKRAALAKYELCAGKNQPVFEIDDRYNDSRIDVLPCGLIDVRKPGDEQGAADASSNDEAADAIQVTINDKSPAGWLVHFELPVSSLFEDSVGTGEFEQVIVGNGKRIYAVIHNHARPSSLAPTPHARIEDSRSLHNLSNLLDEARAQWTSQLRVSRKAKSVEFPAGALTKNMPVDTTLSGRPYTAFIAPVSLPVIRGETDNGDAPLYVVGLRSRADIVESATRFGPRALFTFLVFVTVAIVSWPVLRLLFSQPEHPLTVHHLWAIGLAFLALAAVGATTGAAVHQVRQINGLKLKVAEGIADRLVSELRRGLKQRKEFIRRELSMRDRGLMGYKACPNLNDDCKNGATVCLADNRPEPGLIEHVFATDPAGIVKAPVLAQRKCRQLPEKIDVSKRDYFKNLQQGSPSRFIAQRLFNWVDGMKKLQMAYPLGNAKEEGQAIASGDTTFPSLTAAVMPGGFRFVVFDQNTGSALFHSDDRRSLVENVFLETDHSAALMAAIAAAHRQTLDVQYYGKPHAFVYRSLRHEADPGEPAFDLDWGLLVGFTRDMPWEVATMSWINVVAIVLAVYFIALIIGAVLQRFRKGREILGGLVWPKQQSERYLCSAVLLSVLCLITGATLFIRLPMPWVVGTALVLALVIIPVIQSEWFGRRCPLCIRKWARGRHRAALWSVHLFAAVLMIGVFPSLYLYRSVEDYHLTIRLLEDSHETFDAIRAQRNLLNGTGAKRPVADLFPRDLSLGLWIVPQPHFTCSASGTLKAGLAEDLWNEVPMIMDLVPRYRSGGFFEVTDPSKARFCGYRTGFKFSVYDSEAQYELRAYFRAFLRAGHEGMSDLWVGFLGMFMLLFLTYFLIITRLRGYWSLTDVIPSGDGVPEDEEKELSRELAPLRGIVNEGLIARASEETRGCSGRKIVNWVFRNCKSELERLWRRLDTDEKKLVFQLAHWRVPGPGTALAVDDLAAKGICALEPYPHIESRAFERFVTLVAKPSDGAEWLQPGETVGTWQTVRTPLFLLLAVSVGWLAYSAGDTFQTMAALVAATIGLLANLNKVSDLVRAGA